MLLAVRKLEKLPSMLKFLPNPYYKNCDKVPNDDDDSFTDLRVVATLVYLNGKWLWFKIGSWYVISIVGLDDRIIG